MNYVTTASIFSNRENITFKVLTTVNRHRHTANMNTGYAQMKPLFIAHRRWAVWAIAACPGRRSNR